MIELDITFDHAWPGIGLGALDAGVTTHLA
jgi:hypothetical protein